MKLLRNRKLVGSVEPPAVGRLQVNDLCMDVMCDVIKGWDLPASIFHASI